MSEMNPAENAQQAGAAEEIKDRKGKKKKEKVKKSVGREILEWVLTLLVALCAALLIRSVIFELVRVDGESMLNTLNDKEIMFVSKFDYSSIWLTLPFQSDNTAQQAPRIVYGSPKRLDVVICRYPARGAVNFVKRVTGLPGDTVELRDGYLFINGEQVAAESEIEGISGAYRTGSSMARSFGPYRVPGKGDSLVISDSSLTLQLAGEEWDRKMTCLIAKDADGKTLKIYDRKKDDTSSGGAREATVTVVSYDGKEWLANSAEWLAECPNLVGKEFTVDEDYYFVMGDHRNNSNDSRNVGALERSAVIGHVRRVVFPCGQWRGVD